jgi:hypothetical protein
VSNSVKSSESKDSKDKVTSIYGSLRTLVF